MTHRGTDCATCPFRRERHPYCIDKFIEKYGKDCYELTLKTKENGKY